MNPTDAANFRSGLTKLEAGTPLTEGEREAVAFFGTDRDRARMENRTLTGKALTPPPVVKSEARPAPAARPVTRQTLEKYCTAVFEALKPVLHKHKDDIAALVERLETSDQRQAQLEAQLLDLQATVSARQELVP